MVLRSARNRIGVGAAVVAAIVAAGIAVALMHWPGPPSATTQETPSAYSTDPSGGNAPAPRRRRDAALRRRDVPRRPRLPARRERLQPRSSPASRRSRRHARRTGQSSYDYLAARGVTIVRLAVPWQRLQEIPDGGDAATASPSRSATTYLDVVAEQVRRAAAAGIRTIIDLHNGCTYPWGAGDFVEGSLRAATASRRTHVAHSLADDRRPVRGRRARARRTTSSTNRAGRSGVRRIAATPRSPSTRSAPRATSTPLGRGHPERPSRSTRGDRPGRAVDRRPARQDHVLGALLRERTRRGASTHRGRLHTC